MFKMVKLFSLIFLATGVSLANSEHVVCYFTNWAVYRAGIANFQVSDIDPNLCTIINYAFVGLWGENGTLRVLDSWADFGLEEVSNVIALKENNTDLKVVISMGGWNEGSTNYSIVAGNATLRRNFVNSILEYIEEYNFDGFDLDWEYPGERDGSEDDPENFIILLKELKRAFKKKGYLLTVAVAGAGPIVESAYLVRQLSQTVDLINLMTYDLRTSLINYTAHHAPLYPSSLDTTADEQQLSVSGGVEQWISLGAKPSKLVVGVPFYARSFTLVNESDVGLYAATSGAGEAGPYTLSEGFLSYQEICYVYSNYTYVFDEEQQAPHRYLGDQWFSYDDTRSLTLKAEYIKSKGLGGVMLWDLDFDDFNDSCGNGTYPLLNTLVNVLNN